MEKFEQSVTQGEARQPQRGVALVFALLGITILSMLAAALMFVTSSGSFASMNFKSQMQASFAANAGQQIAIDWFRNTYATWLDATVTAVPLTATYDTTGAQPLLSGNPVKLATTTTSNFPDSTTIASFAGIKSGSLTMGNAQTAYDMTATLKMHKQGKDIDGNPLLYERWQIDVTGTSGGTLGTSTVTESALVERFFAPLFKDAIRGQCEVNLGGNINTDSYYSTAGAYGGGNLYTGASAGASVGSNTFIQASGNSGTINGNAYYGTATATCPCSSSPCEDFNHPEIVQGDVVEAPGIPFPAVPSWDMTSPQQDDCSNGTILMPTNVGTPPIYPQTSGGHYHRCRAVGTDVVTLCLSGLATTATANFFFNTIDFGAQSSLVFKTLNTSTGACTQACDATHQCAGARIYANYDFDVGGGGIVGMFPADPTKMSVIYTGTRDSSYTGNADFYGTIYAPNSTVTLRGGAVIYGAVSAKNVSDNGDVTVHYDLSLQSQWGYLTTFRLINQTRNIF